MMKIWKNESNQMKSVFQTNQANKSTKMCKTNECKITNFFSFVVGANGHTC